MITNSNILKDKKLTKFLEEELSKYPSTPVEFEDNSYIPSKEEIEAFSDYELDYLVMSANMDVSDMLSFPEECEQLEKRYNIIKEMVLQEKLKRGLTEWNLKY